MSQVLSLLSPRITQIMGNVLAYRVNPGFPFAKSGTDYSGKGSSICYYTTFFVCMATLVVHPDLVEDSTSESFIAAFHRFTARRGHFTDLYSDLGTNFVGADKEFRELFVEFTQYSSVIYHQITVERTRWHLNPRDGGITCI